MKYKITPIIPALFCLLLTAGNISADDSERAQKRCNQIYQMRALEALSQSTPTPANIFSDEGFINHTLRVLSQNVFLEENWILPYKNSARIAKRIDMLLQELEKGEATEAAQAIQFNIAYEYFLFYLSFLNENYILGFQKEKNELRAIDIDQLISNQELSQYLLQAQLYLQGLTSYVDTEDAAGRTALSDAFRPGGKGSSSFIIRDNTALYMNVNFLTFMVECEKLAGRFHLALSEEPTDEIFSVGPPSESAVRYHDKHTWDWLNELWKRYQFQQDSRAGAKSSSATEFSTYCPSARTLFSLYRIYLSYNFMWRYLVDTQQNSPSLNALTRVMMQRLSTLSKDANQAASFNTSYLYYHVESAKDGGQTNFLPPLLFARRGHFMAHRINNNDIGAQQLFDLYGTFFMEAADSIRNNITYRSQVYNELVVFGISLKDLHLMESTLYGYARRSMRIEPENDYTGREFARSARLTTAFLLANILEAKAKSGLYQGCDRYRELGNALAGILVSVDNNNWQYASTIHSSLAQYYSRENYFDEALAMYHARQIGRASCRERV